MLQMHLDEYSESSGGPAHLDGTLHLNKLSKIEGHGSLDIRIKEGKVKYVKLKITENKRFFTQAVLGKPALALPTMTSRICGTCSIAHLTCCSEAVEHAMAFEPTEQTLLLRKLSLYGMTIRDHALHLYMFCLPDLFGKDSILDFDKSHDEMIRRAFAIKSSGNNLSKAISGRAVHSTFRPGGTLPAQIRGPGKARCRKGRMKPAETQLAVGGQAVRQGDDERSPHALAIAVRRPDGSICLKDEPYQSRPTASRS